MVVFQIHFNKGFPVEVVMLNINRMKLVAGKVKICFTANLIEFLGNIAFALD